MMMMRACPNIEYLWTRKASKGGPFMHTRPTLTSNPETIFNIYCELLKKTLHHIEHTFVQFRRRPAGIHFVSYWSEG